MHTFTSTETYKNFVWWSKPRKARFRVSRSKIYGILFDVAWLWEEYVYTLLPKGFVHPRNKDKTDGISVFSVGKRKVYPDFYDRERKIVLDAKYKKTGIDWKGINREDLFQLISYSYILKAEKAGLVFPSKDKVIDNEMGNLAGYGALLKKWSIQIPQKSSSYSAFCKMMENSEENFKAIIDEEVGENNFLSFFILTQVKPEQYISIHKIIWQKLYFGL